MELFTAIENGDTERIRTILDAEPQLARARNANGVSAVLWALYVNQRAIAEELAAAAGELTIHEAAALDDVEQLRELLASGTRPSDEPTPDGYTPLHLAAYFCASRAAALLVEHGADLDATTPDGERPAQSAEAGGCAELAALLRDAAVD